MAREHQDVDVYATSRVGTVFGDKGPDKYTFLFEGLLDRTYDGRDHEFVIDNRKMDVTIRGGKPIASWLCPNLPGVPEGRVEHEWEDAWEFWGVAGDGTGGYGIRAIYSPKSRKGVYHYWRLYTANEGCPAARDDMQEFFAARTNDAALLALDRAMKHMVRGSAVAGHHVDCHECWELFGTLRHSAYLP